MALMMSSGVDGWLLGHPCTEVLIAVKMIFDIGQIKKGIKMIERNLERK